MDAESKLRAVKIVHTVVWAVFAGCIVAIPACTYLGHLRTSAELIGFVMLEVAVLTANRMRCPLTDVAARYTDERAANFDIYLPVWLARNNQRIFGWWFVGDVIYTLVAWWMRGA